ncbi:MAG: deaminase [Verrucomicrobiota bacterium]
MNLPDWLQHKLNEVRSISWGAPELLMQLAIELSMESVDRGGGPFGAVIYDPKTDGIVSLGVNLVLPQECSLWHAEVVAIYYAQQWVKSHSLRSDGSTGLELYSSCEPCMMCQGAVFWSGIGHLYYGATDADAREIGFDEGIKNPDWKAYFEQRGIQVSGELLREEARAVLREYVESGGALYNA